jgi:hypothetical protein
LRDFLGLSSPLSPTYGQVVCDAVLVRALDLIEKEMPSLLATLFGNCREGEKHTCLWNRGLRFAEGESGRTVFHTCWSTLAASRVANSVCASVGIRSAASLYFCGGGGPRGLGQEWVGLIQFIAATEHFCEPQKTSVRVCLRFRECGGPCWSVTN